MRHQVTRTMPRGLLRSGLFAVLILYGNVLYADDPTTPSSKLLERIRPEPAVTTASVDSESENTRLLQQLKMKAMVLRDADNGTALVSLGKAQTYTVRLRRMGRSTQATRLDIGSHRIAVQEFSSTSITFIHLDAKQQFTVRSR